jgi:hypothetical protein
MPEILGPIRSTHLTWLTSGERTRSLGAIMGLWMGLSRGTRWRRSRGFCKRIVGCLERIGTMTTHKDVLIVMGHNGNPHYVEMANLAVEYIERQGYPYRLVQMGEKKFQEYPMHMKSVILKGAFASSDARWIVWMDVDSVMVNPIDEMFEGDYDLGVPRKEEGAPLSRNHGSYLYSGIMVWQRGPGAMWLLNELGNNEHISDQKRLHEIIQPHISLDSIEVGQTYQTVQYRLKIFDQDKYFHMTALHEMRRWDEGVKVLHFKGGLHRKGTWALYKEKFL